MLSSFKILLLLCVLLPLSSWLYGLKCRLTVILWRFERQRRQILLHVVSPLSLSEPLCLLMDLSVLLVFASLPLFLIKIYADLDLKFPTAIYHLSQAIWLIRTIPSLLNPFEIHCYNTLCLAYKSTPRVCLPSQLNLCGP